MHELRIECVKPVVPGDVGGEFSEAETAILVGRRLRIPQVDAVVLTRGGGDHYLAVNGHQIAHASLMVDVPAHQIDPTG